jgi:hypothetical protein
MALGGSSSFNGISLHLFLNRNKIPITVSDEKFLKAENRNDRKLKICFFKRKFLRVPHFNLGHIFGSFSMDLFIRKHLSFKVKHFNSGSCWLFELDNKIMKDRVL